MSTTNVVHPEPLSNPNMNVVEDGLCSGFQFILGAYSRCLAAIADSLSSTELAAKTQQLISELKLQQDSLVSNISESLSLIDEMWLLTQSHFERQLAVISHMVDQGEPPANGPVNAADL